TIQDSGYAITGNDLSLAGDLFATYATGSSTYSLATTLLADANVDVASGGALAIDGAISDGASSFALTKDGMGTLALLGANSYDGATTISAGVLQVDGTIASAVVLAGGTLSGSGTLSGAEITPTGVSSIDPGS